MPEATVQAQAVTYVDALESASAMLQAGIEQAQQGLKSALEAKLEVDQLIHESRSALSSSPEAIETHLRAAVETYLQRLKEPAAIPSQETLAANAELSEAEADQPESKEPDLEGLKAGIDEEVLGTRYTPIEDDEFEGADSVNPEALKQPQEAAESPEEPGATEALAAEQAENTEEASWTEGDGFANAQAVEAVSGAQEQSENMPAAASAGDNNHATGLTNDWTEEGAEPEGEQHIEPAQEVERAAANQGEPATIEESGDADAQASEQDHAAHEEEGKSEEGSGSEETHAPKRDSDSVNMEPEDASSSKQGIAESLMKERDDAEHEPPQKRRSVLGLLKGR